MLATRAGRSALPSGNPPACMTAANPNPQLSLKQNFIEMFHPSIDQTSGREHAVRKPQCYHFHVSRAGYVLVGGRSSRMGRDKALLPFRGGPLVRSVARAVERLPAAPRSWGMRIATGIWAFR